MYKFSTSPLSIGGVLKDSWQLYQEAFTYVFMWALIIAIIHVIPQFFGYKGFYEVTRDGHMYFAWDGISLFAVLLAPEAFCVVVLFYILHLIATHQKLRLLSALNHGFYTFFKVYAGMVIYYILVNLGLFLFILPAVFVGVLFAMFLPMVIIERKKLYQSFDESARLVWGHWWQTFFILVAPYAVSYFARNFARFTTWGGYWVLLLDGIILMLIMPYFYTTLLVQYHNLKVIKSTPHAKGEWHRTQS